MLNNLFQFTSPKGLLHWLISATLLLTSAASSFAVPPLTQDAPFQDGIYLYGESAEADKIGQEYLVFEVKHNQVRGAAYLPQSEFSCFEGTTQDQVLSLTLRDPYEDIYYDWAIAIQRQSLVALANNQGIEVSTILEGYVPLETVSNNDLRILDTCHNSTFH